MNPLVLLVCWTCLLLCFVDMNAEARKEQRAVLKFMIREGKRPVDCWRALSAAFPEGYLSRSTVAYWIKRFKSGDEDTKDKKRTGRPITVSTQNNVTRISAAIDQEKRQTVSGIASSVGLGRTSVFKMMKKDLKLSKLAPKFAPEVLTQEQKDFRVRLCRMNIASLQEDTELLNKIVTGDKSMVSMREVETKQQSAQWTRRGTHAEHPQKALRTWSTRKSMITVFFNAKGVVLSEFLPQGETIDTDAYCATLKRLKEAIRKKRKDLWLGRKFILHHDNASPHTSAPTLALIRESAINMLPHPPYSPDLAPCNFFIFPRLKSELWGRDFRRLVEMQEAVKLVLRRIPQEEFQACMDSLPIHWMKCIKAEGSYFEGSHLVVDPEGDFGLFFGPPDEDSDSESSD